MLLIGLLFDFLQANLLVFSLQFLLSWSKKINPNFSKKKQSIEEENTNMLLDGTCSEKLFKFEDLKPFVNLKWKKN